LSHIHEDNRLKVNVIIKISTAIFSKTTDAVYKNLMYLNLFSEQT